LKATRLHVESGPNGRPLTLNQSWDAFDVADYVLSLMPHQLGDLIVEAKKSQEDGYSQDSLPTVIAPTSSQEFLPLVFVKKINTLCTLPAPFDGQTIYTELKSKNNPTRNYPVFFGEDRSYLFKNIPCSEEPTLFSDCIPNP
jgi:hypothetical protein